MSLLMRRSKTKRGAFPVKIPRLTRKISLRPNILGLREILKSTAQGNFSVDTLHKAALFSQDGSLDLHALRTTIAQFLY